MYISEQRTNVQMTQLSVNCQWIEGMFVDAANCLVAYLGSDGASSEAPSRSHSYRLRSSGTKRGLAEDEFRAMPCK